MNKIYKITRFCLITLIVTVFITNIAKHIATKDIDYTLALGITTYDDIESYGIFIRDEYIVENHEQSYVHIDITNGSRVKKGQDIAITYKQREFFEESIAISQLRDKLSVIDSVVTVTQAVSDSLKTAIQINKNIAELNQNIDPNDLTTISYNLKEIEKLALKNEYSKLTKEQLVLEKANIENEILLKQTKISQDTSNITADLTGTFIATIDSFENIDDITIDTIEKIVDFGNQNFANNQQIGKIIISNEWQFACVVDTEDVGRITDALKPRLIFENMPSSEILVTIDEIINEGEKSIVIFAGKATNETILQMRSSNVQIILKSYNGIKIPKQSVVVSDGKLGVYTLSGAQTNFTEITPVFEKENYYVMNVESQATKNDIIIGDKIVINSSSLVTPDFIS